MRRALYREYRPRRLSEIIGQPHIVTALEKSLHSGQISHAYLFIGPRGTGKTSIARILAHAINDFPYEIESDHLDIIEIDAASNTGVDHIRTLRENAHLAPSLGKYKVYIIDEVHMLSKSAFNALLKTLEEPPAHVIFIMATTDAHKVPITITSRSQTYTFKLANLNTITDHLKKIARSESIPIKNDALQLIARRSHGSFRDAISLLDQISTFTTGEITCALLETALGLPSDQLIQQLIDSYLAADSSTTRIALQNLLEQGIKPEVIAEDLAAFIVADPIAPLLPLLDQLIAVSSSPHPEIKLLLALLTSSQAPDQAPPKTKARAAPATTKSAPSQPQSNTDNEPQSDSVSEPQNDVANEPQAESNQETTKSSVARLSKDSTVSWPTLLDTIKQDHPALHSLLTRTTTELKSHTLYIYTKNRMIRTKIDQKRTLLAGLLPENITIELSDQPLTTDPLIDHLSSIFGTVEEVSL